MLPKRRIFEALFKCVSNQLGARTIEKSIENPELFFCPIPPKYSFGRVKLDSQLHNFIPPKRRFYARQTKILEGGTKDEMQIFDTLFNGSWPKLSTHTLEKCVEHLHFIFGSAFQNLRLVSINLSQDNDSIMMCLSSSHNSQDDDSMTIA
jgi:hypothetical protein